MPQAHQDDIEYVDIRPSSGPLGREPTSFHEKWVDQSSAKHSTPELTAAEALRKLYPGYSLVASDDHRLGNLLEFPGVTVQPADSDSGKAEEVANVTFAAIPKRIDGKVPGALVDNIILGSYKLTWKNKAFIVHIARVPQGMMIKTIHFFLYNGPEQATRDLVLSVCLYAEQTHDEIWVFNQGFWTKNRTLWLEIKDSSWDDVVMKETSKKALQRDVYGFFKSEMIYKKLSIPWKRGLIMYGPPGNGKTISIKVIMRTCTELGFTPLYVKSFQSFQGEEVAMQNVFLKARQLAPCVLVLEDLDSLINDKNRAFFLNQLDGLEGNDGLLVVATTNHFDKLDPGLSKRPSRFDRKYLFDDPDREERLLYAKYWQAKLKDSDEISFPDSLVEEVADLTQGFSFAHLKEAFVSTLVRISNSGDEHVNFPVMLKTQIISLRGELGKQVPSRVPPPPPLPRSRKEKGVSIQITDVKPLGPSPSKGKEDRFPSMKCGVARPPSPNDFESWDDAYESVNDGDIRESRIVGQDDAPLPPSLNGKIYRTVPPAGVAPRLFRRCVLPAPASAYPQAMPGSLPSQTVVSGMTQDLMRDPMCSGRPAGSVTRGPGNSRQRNPFPLSDPAPLVIFDDVHDGGESPGSGV